MSSYTAEAPERAVDSSAYSPVGAGSGGFPPAAVRVQDQIDKADQNIVLGESA